jgi:hypothetical protein
MSSGGKALTMKRRLRSCSARCRGVLQIMECAAVAPAGQAFPTLWRRALNSSGGCDDDSHVCNIHLSATTHRRLIYAARTTIMQGDAP